MKPNEVITTARYIILDDASGSIAPRQSNTELLAYFNDGLREVCTHMPALFSTVGDMTCIAGKVEQSITFLDANRLLDVLCIHGGAALTQFDRASMDAFNPAWRSVAAGAARQWAPLEGDPLQFFLDRPAPADQILDVRYIRNPGIYGLDDTVLDLPDSFRPAMVDYLVYRAESKDDENVVNQRAAGHYQAFLAKIGAK